MYKKVFFVMLLIVAVIFGFMLYNVQKISPQATQEGLKKVELSYKEVEKQNYSKAIEMLNEVIAEDNPGTIYQAYYNKAFCYDKMYRFDSVTKILELVLNIPETHPEYDWFRYSSFFMLGRNAGDLGQTEIAINYFNKAIKHKQAYEIYNTMAFYEMRLSRFDSALVHINRAIGYNNNNSGAFCMRALICLKLHHIDQAKADTEEAIRLDPSNPYAFKHRAMINIELKEIEKACADLNKANELDYKKHSWSYDENEVDSLLNTYCK